MRRAILGGTFDPPHLAHLFAGEAAYRQLDLDVVTYIPAGAPWQKTERDVTEPRHRWAMTRLAVGDVDYFEPDGREVDRDGWTYTIDTLETFADDDEITLVLGSDAAVGLTSWNRHQEVVGRVRIAVMPRSGTTVDDVRLAVPHADVVGLDTPLLRISGTELRRRAGDGHSLRFLVRDPVWRYITQEGLYGIGPDPT